MDFFHSKKSRESVLLIDIGASSVAGAYVSYDTSELPTILFTRRLPVEPRTEESPEHAMLRTLQALGEILIREGAPILLRAVGSGSADRILVCVDTPWQETRVRTENFDAREPFVFTESLVDDRLEETSYTPHEKMIADESIVGTILNGYETHDPYGKKVQRASIIVLTSLIHTETAEGILSVLRRLYHTKNIFPIASGSLRYQAMRAAFPHEDEVLILDATGPRTFLELVRGDLLIATVLMDDTAANTHTWGQQVLGECTKLAAQYPLPRTIFILSDERVSSALQESLGDLNLSSLWLSDTPPKIVSVLASHLTVRVRQATTEAPDLALLLMAIYQGKTWASE